MNSVLLISLFVLSFSAILFNQSFSIRDNYAYDNHPAVQANNFSPLFPCLWLIDTILQPLLNFPPFFSSPPPSEPTRSPAEDRRLDECRQILFKNVDTNCYVELLKSFDAPKILLRSDCCRKIMLVPDDCFNKIPFTSDHSVTSKLKNYCSKKLTAAPSA
ncbi:hypothetical protein E1A91_A08G243700v1 [Gossypium mustelinum]|uniref:Uncharacterized protein n=3 Tax=Gossypium TaxID=3633 RepID=A0A5J5UVR6_GOSBA|nr:hypothetical protein ES319_A08G235200v1 [Gossypium barbadense]TYH07762.1 hypothetical protein ES288_A08G260000v1 [Gossypium darwinii]TYJ24185.1 hypothetical protein E1A91_A08G243700v1 [Gossypium mustelinum]